ncbi:30S ribosomal protein S9 [Chloroflexota bacterium]
MSEQIYYNGTGRRKTSIAQVRLMKGEGVVIINGKPMEESVARKILRDVIMKPLILTETSNQYNAVVKVAGGGITGQAGAIAHGISRALIKANENLRPVLKKNGMLTRDSRMKERKKYGLKRARKAPQYTKR